MNNEIQGELTFASKFIDMIDEGRKTTTVRRGVRQYASGVYDLYNPKKSVHGYVVVDDIKITTFGELTEDVAKTDGFNSLEELKNELLSFYPELVNDSPVTIVYISKFE